MTRAAVQAIRHGHGWMSWLRRLAAGWLAAWMWLGVNVGPARADAGEPVGWTVDLATQVASVGRVRLQYEPHLEEGATYLAEQIPSWWSEIEQSLALDLPDDLHIIYVDHAGRISEASRMPRWVAGVARPATGEIMIARHGPDGSTTDLKALLRHEMAHVALHRASGGAAVPRWFNEGLAESFENNVDLGRTQTLAQVVFGGGVPKLGVLEAQFRERDPQAASAAYAAARDLVNFMRFADPHEATLRHLLTQLRLGYAFDAAVIRAYGRSPEELATEWRSGLPARFLWFPLLSSGGIPVVVVAPLMLAAWFRRRRLLRSAWERLEREDEALRDSLGAHAAPA